MSRELEFRAWNDIDKQYIEWSTLKSVFGKILSNRHYTVEQFTGLLDCNGVKIFEGDIVTGEYHNLSVNYDTRSKVEWGRTCDSDGLSCGETLGWVTSNGSSLIDLVEGGSSGDGECKVVGNIHENKE